MKLWLKYIIGIILGFGLALALPQAGPASFLSFLSELCIRCGRYIVPPLVFFSVTVGVFRLKESNNIFKTFLLLVIVIASSSLLLTIFAVLAGVVIKLPHIPISVETISAVSALDITELLRKIFPYSGFSTLLDGIYLLPLFIFAGFAGGGCAVDTVASKPTIALFNSLSKVCYNIVTFFTDMLSIGIISVLYTWTISFFTAQQTGVFMPLFLLLLGLFIIITFVLYPIAIHLLFPTQIRYPARILYASLCPVLVSFFSGDSKFTLPYLMRHGKDSLGIRGRINSVSYTVFSIFSRSGAAVVTAIAFIIILRSYSSLNIAFSDILWIAGVSFALSFALGAIPAGGTFIALTVLCSLYGRGFETGYLLFKSAAPIICSFAAAIDTVTAMFGTYIIALKLKLIEYHETKLFI